MVIPPSRRFCQLQKLKSVPVRRWSLKYRRRRHRHRQRVFRNTYMIKRREMGRLARHKLKELGERQLLTRHNKA